MKKVIGAIAITAGFLLPNSTIAAPPPDVFKDFQGNIYKHNLANNNPIKFEYAGVPYKRDYRAGYCGEIKLSKNSTIDNISGTVTVNSSTIDLDSLPTVNSRCVGNTITPTVTGNFKDPNGAFYITGFTPGLPYSVTFNNANASRVIAPNACGFIKISSTSSLSLPSTFKIDGTSYTLASLTEADPPICQRNNKYIPDSWN